jgi:hypothetical protein
MSYSLNTLKGNLAIKQPEFKKIEAQVSGGVAMISQRVNLIEVQLVMDYEVNGIKLRGGVDKVILRGDAGVQPWAKQKLALGVHEFVLCPESQVIGYARYNRDE